MKPHPPLSERSNEELFEIIENKEGWKPEVFASAQEELVSRGISVSTQNKRRQGKRKQQSRIQKIKSASRYSVFQMIGLILFGWPIVMILRDFEIFYSGEGYHRKNTQGILAAILGLLFWGIVFYLMNQIYFE